jgi:hypothetical protein
MVTEIVENVPEKGGEKFSAGKKSPHRGSVGEF